ncbi:hypothetical protein WAX78_01500 [Bacillus sp. FJAT-53711]|uniref:Uncharacterized protein n=1 Tax=Bacillus yunxiaonensis TaxID=3127665 RepID=A0ABU8FQA6_9BACI
MDTNIYLLLAILSSCIGFFCSIQGQMFALPYRGLKTEELFSLFFQTAPNVQTSLGTVIEQLSFLGIDGGALPTDHLLRNFIPKNDIKYKRATLLERGSFVYMQEK